MSTNWALEMSRALVPATGTANLFGVVLYTARHAQVRRMLADKAFWLGLDEASGPHWAVFATQAEAGTFEIPPASPGSVSLMIRVWREPAANAELLSAFELKSTKKLPALAVFAETASGVVYSTLIEINQDSEALAYKSLAGALEEVNECISGMDDECRPVDAQAYHIVDEHFKNKGQWKLLKSAGSFLALLKSMM